MAIDKRNPVDRKEFIEMAAVTNVGGSVFTPATAPVIVIVDPVDKDNIQTSFDDLVAALKTAGVLV